MHGYVYALITTVEETLEMVGTVLFINALIKFMHLNKLGVKLMIR